MDLEKLIEQLTKLENSVSGMLDTTPLTTAENPLHDYDFQISGDIKDLRSLPVPGLNDPQLPSLVLRHLNPYFVAGLLIERRAWRGMNQWSLTESTVAGEHQTWPPDQQKDLSALIRPLRADEVRRTPSAPLLARLPLQLKLPVTDTDAYLMVPTPEVAYIWFSRTPLIWAESELRHALKLITQAFAP